MDTALKIDPKNKTSDSTQDTLVATESIIKSRLHHIELLNSEIKNLREMHNDYLENDPKYSEASEAAKEASKEKSSAKKEALSKPEAESIIEKLKEAREQLKDLKTTLSASLRDYERLSGTDQIEIEPGDMRKIVYTAKLVKADSRFGR
jgi:hypothetical protein